MAGRPRSPCSAEEHARQGAQRVEAESDHWAGLAARTRLRGVNDQRGARCGSHERTADVREGGGHDLRPRGARRRMRARRAARRSPRELEPARRSAGRTPPRARRGLPGRPAGERLRVASLRRREARGSQREREAPAERSRCGVRSHGFRRTHAPQAGRRRDRSLRCGVRSDGENPVRRACRACAKPVRP